MTLRILEGLANALSDRGRAILCVEWARSEGNEWLPRLRRALSAEHLHVVHFDLFRTAAEDYCVMLAPYLFAKESNDYGRFLKSMLRHFHQYGISTIDLVIHAIEKASDGKSREWLRSVPLESLGHVTAEAVDRSFAMLRAAGVPDEILVEASFRTADGLSFTPKPDEGVQIVWVSGAPKSLVPEAYLKADVARLVERFAAGRTLKQAYGPGIDSEAIALLRDAIRRGFLIPHAGDAI